MGHIVNCVSNDDVYSGGGYQVYSTGRNTRWSNFWACQGFHSIPLNIAPGNENNLSIKKNADANQKSFFEKYWLALLLIGIVGYMAYKK